MKVSRRSSSASLLLHLMFSKVNVREMNLCVPAFLACLCASLDSCISRNDTGVYTIGSVHENFTQNSTVHAKLLLVHFDMPSHNKTCCLLHTIVLSEIHAQEKCCRYIVLHKMMVGADLEQDSLLGKIMQML